MTVPYGSTARFYYPVVPEESGDLLIFVNKTSPIGHEGDATLLLNVQKNSENSYLSWFYPSSTRFTIASETNDPIQPEMIDICKEKLIEACGGADASTTTLEDAASGVTNDCSLLISLYSKIEDEDANLRLRVFNSTNKLYPEKPVHGTHKGLGAFKYYWFLSTGAMEAEETKEYWQHTIAMGITTLDADFDLFVSVMDGRYPTDIDLDYSSTNLGADSIFLSSDDPKFQRSNKDSWNPAVGMVVVIGVKSLQEEEAEFSLVMNGPKYAEY